MKITLIGLGAMGTAIAERLLQANYELTVFNRSPQKARPLLNLGAQSADSVERAVIQADVVLTMLLDDKAVMETTLAMVSHMKTDAVHIGLSTVLPTTAEAVFDMHQKHNTHYISGAVLGVPEVVRQGGLTTFCAGKEELIEQIHPVLSTFSENIFPLGSEKDIKAPNLMKICMNYSLMTAIELMGELFVFAEKSGLDKEIVKAGLKNIYAHPGFQRYIDKIADRDFDNINFTMQGGQKDARIFQKSFSEAGVTPELVRLLNSRYDDALASDMQEKDWSAIYEVIRNKSGLN